MLIVERFLESLMPPYEYQHIKVHLVVGQFKFVLNENVTTQLGFKALKQQETNCYSESFKNNQTVNIQHTDIKSHQTTPPDYFNEGTLLKAMESPQNYIHLDDKKHVHTPKEAGVLGLLPHELILLKSSSI